MRVQRLRTLDPVFAEAAATGLLWEVLSWRIELAEPDGCRITQAALNAKNGFFLLRHELQALAKITCVSASTAVAERQLSADACRFACRRHCSSSPRTITSHNFSAAAYTSFLFLGRGRHSRSHQGREAVPREVRGIRIPAAAAGRSRPPQHTSSRSAASEDRTIETKAHHRTPRVRLLQDSLKDWAAPEVAGAATFAEDLLFFLHESRMDAAQLSQRDKIKF